MLNRFNFVALFFLLVCTPLPLRGRALAGSLGAPAAPPTDCDKSEVSNSRNGTTVAYGERTKEVVTVTSYLPEDSHFYRETVTKESFACIEHEWWLMRTAEQNTDTDGKLPGGTLVHRDYRDERTRTLKEDGTVSTDYTTFLQSVADYSSGKCSIDSTQIIEMPLKGYSQVFGGQRSGTYQYDPKVSANRYWTSFKGYSTYNFKTPGVPEEEKHLELDISALANRVYTGNYFNTFGGIGRLDVQGDNINISRWKSGDSSALVTDFMKVLSNFLFTLDSFGTFIISKIPFTEPTETLKECAPDVYDILHLTKNMS